MKNIYIQTSLTIEAGALNDAINRQYEKKTADHLHKIDFPESIKNEQNGSFF